MKLRQMWNNARHRRIGRLGVQDVFRGRKSMAGNGNAGGTGMRVAAATNYELSRLEEE